MKFGRVALIGRPNTGKSTLVNSLIGQKVAITSPKPQTTHFPIYAVYEDTRGQIVFVDTPGVFAKTSNERSKMVNLEAESILKDGIDVVLYLIDHTRGLGIEEEKVLSLIRNLSIPKVLGINKIDILSPDFSNQYDSIRNMFDTVVELSALKEWHLKNLLQLLFERLPEGNKIVDRAQMPFPVLNLDSRMYIEELIREKAFRVLWDELPYTVRVVVESIEERDEDRTYIKAILFTTNMRYKKMIIGKDASTIKEIGTAVRKELSAMTGRKVFLDLTVDIS